MKKLLRDKSGMTLTEIVVALTILMLVIVGSTPVLLSSYDSLYTAGEYTQETYEAKSEIEDILATRNTMDVYEQFKVNFKNLGEVAAINGKRAISSLYGSLETVFTGGRAHVAIVSSKVINDDKIKQEVSLQVTNISFNSISDITANSSSLVVSKTKAIDITVMRPDKSTDILSKVYSLAKTGNVVVKSANPATGRIIVEIQGLDFTNSPAKIQVTYRDENDKVRTTSCYLTIKTPTIMLAGSTNYGQYYTTAGVETITRDDGSTYSELKVDAREMDVSGASGTIMVPQGTVFKSVNWVTEQNNGEFSNEYNYEPSYYVLTGTNGAIYRTYTFTGVNDLVGRVNLSTSDAQVNGTTQNGQDVIGLTDYAFTLDDAARTLVYPSVWGGDFSHYYGYSSYDKSMGYYNQGTWYTQDGSTSGKGQQGYYSNFANFGYYYNGYGMRFNWYTQNSKKISYVLTELDYALRVAGYMNDVGDFDQSFNRMWERPIVWKSPTVWESQKESGFKHTSWGSTTSQGWYYYKDGEDFPRSVAVQANKDNDKFSDDHVNTLPVFFAANTSGQESRWGDESWAQIRLKGLTTLDPNFLYWRWMDQTNGESDGFDKEQSSVKFAYNKNVNKSKIAVTDAVYLPPTATTRGGMFYVGTVAAYAYLQQADNVSTDANDAKRIRNNGEDNRGGMSTYYLMGNAEGTNTTVYKYSTSGKGTDGIRTVFSNKTDASILTGAGVKANSTESHKFYVTRSAGGTAVQLFNDVQFTLGFASNREMVFSKIVYGADSTGAVKEANKFCEPLYFLSHYDDLTDTHVPHVYMTASVDTAQVTGQYLNSTENDYYNVWFPGEMYNLTKVATKDGVTVSVGYAVAGSTYTWINPVDSAAKTNVSTGLGGVYNDGVLAAMVLGKDASFTNLLYYKDNISMDKTSLSDDSVPYFSGADSYNSYFGIDYGTHTRNSVQFTAVDISIEYTVSGNSEVATYYAYYADNLGRLYKSLIATKTTAKGATTPSTPQMVSYISDKSTPSSAPSYMEEIKIEGMSMGKFFSKITTVTCSGDYILVSGHSADGNFNIVVGHINKSDDQTSNTVEWKLLRIMGAAAYQTEDMLVLDGYVYIAGVSVANPNLHRGFLYAVTLEELRRLDNGGIIPFNDKLFVGDENLRDRIFAIDGHSN